MSSTTVSGAVLENLPVLFYSIAVILHTVGITLLIKLKRKRHQDLIIMHLSITELFMCLLDIAQNVIMRYGYVTPVTSQIIYYVIMVNCCFFVVPSFLIIITLTLDRFMEVYLNLKYHLYCKNAQVKCILVANWIVGAVLGVVLIALRVTKGTKSLKIVYLVVFPCLQLVFLLIATVTYAYIYQKFKSKFKRLFLGKVSPAVATEHTCHHKNNNNTPDDKYSLPPLQESTPYGIDSIRRRENNNDNNNNDKKRHSFWDVTQPRKVVVFNGLVKPADDNNIDSTPKRKRRRRRKATKNVPFKRRNFFAPSLIVLSFVLFVVIPDMLNLLINYLKIIEGTASTYNILLCLYSMGFIMDGIVYIFLQRHLRTMLVKLLSRRKWIQHVTTSMHEAALETSR